MKQKLQLRIGQSLKMTPQLQQAIRLLQLSSLELQTEIQQIIEANPLLEQEDNLGEVTLLELEAAGESESMSEDNTSTILPGTEVVENRSEQRLPDELDIDARWDQIYDSPQTSGGTASTMAQDHREMFENQAGEIDDLKQHLVWQLDCSRLSETDQQIGLAIIDSIDDGGYLAQPLEDIYEGLQNQFDALELDEVEAVLHLIQRFDPVGVAARSPAECMLIQLEQYDPATPHLAKARLLVEHYLEHLAGNDVALLRRRLQANESELAEIIHLIQTTNPHPGDSVSRNHAEYVVPDVYVSKRAGSWRVSINPDNSPRLQINRQYAKLIKRRDNSVDNTYLRDHLQEARWFIKSLESRNNTLLRVAEAIVERQHAYLDYGEEAMQPMVLRDIAEQLELHESTISRVTSNKYMHTPRGIVEFKYFFSSHVNTSDGGECSATAIRAIIRKLVAAEAPEKPLSDSKITSLLEQQGIKVARRTVAKYREAMHIPPSNERKRLF